MEAKWEVILGAIITASALYLIIFNAIIRNDVLLVIIGALILGILAIGIILMALGYSTIQFEKAEAKPDKPDPNAGKRKKETNL